MRVLMVTSFPIPGEYDGTAMLPIKILRALKPRGVDVVVAYFRLRPPPGCGPGLRISRVRRCSTFPPAGWIGGSGLRRIARKLPFDVVHAQHYGGATRAYAACRRNGWPMVYEIHSLLGDEVERKRLGRGLVFRSYLAVEQRRLPARCASHRAGRASQAGRRHGEGRSGRPGERDLSGHRPRPSTSVPADRRRSPACGPENKVIMYIGSIVHPNQGVPILIEALPRIFESRPDARCVLVGGPAEAGERYRAQLGPHGEKLDRPDRPDPRSGRRADAPCRCSGPSPARLP